MITATEQRIQEIFAQRVTADEHIKIFENILKLDLPPQHRAYVEFELDTYIVHRKHLMTKWLDLVEMTEEDDPDLPEKDKIVSFYIDKIHF